jgi:hypothetical protein
MLMWYDATILFNMKDLSNVDFDIELTQPLNYLKNHVVVGGRDLGHMPNNTIRRFGPGGGDCLLYSFKNGCAAAEEYSIQDLREAVVQIMTSHRILFSGIYNMSLNYGGLGFDAYLASVLEKEYGDDLCIAALAMKFKTQIHIFRQSFGSPNVIVWEFLPIDLQASEPVTIWNLVRNNSCDHFDSISFSRKEKLVYFQIALIVIIDFFRLDARRQKRKVRHYTM